MLAAHHSPLVSHTDKEALAICSALNMQMEAEGYINWAAWRNATLFLLKIDCRPTLKDVADYICSDCVLGSVASHGD